MTIQAPSGKVCTEEGQEGQPSETLGRVEKSMPFLCSSSALLALPALPGPPDRPSSALPRKGTKKPTATRHSERCPSCPSSMHTQPRKRHSPDLVQMRRYLANYARDRQAVWTTLHKAQVDRIYRHDSAIRTWTAHWHQASGTPYLTRRDCLIFPDDCAPSIRERIITEHHANEACS